MWSSHDSQGFEGKRLANKIKRLHRHFMGFQSIFGRKRVKGEEAPTRVKQLDNLQDRRTLD